MRYTRVGGRREPLWGSLLAKPVPYRVALFPLALYEILLYQWRADVTAKKARPWIWRDSLQSRWRYVQALLCYLGPPSHLLWNIMPMLVGILAVAAGVSAYERVTDKLLDRDNVSYRAYRATVFVVSLLLSNRINRGCERWWNARVGFRGAGSAVIALAYLTPVWRVPEEIHAELCKWGAVWHFALKAELFGEKRLAPSVEALLDDDDRRRFYGHAKPRHFAGNMIRMLIQEACEAHTGGMRQEMFTELMGALQRGYDSMSQCNRISQQALPEGLTQLSSGFLCIWLFFMPLGLWDTHSSWMGWVSVSMMSIMMLACDELANQLEHPFELLQIDATLKRTLQAMQKAVPSSDYMFESRREFRERNLLKQVAIDCEEAAAQAATPTSG